MLGHVAGDGDDGHLAGHARIGDAVGAHLGVDQVGAVGAAGGR
jgi:hypothetical protein